MSKLSSRRRAFTLVELLVVLAIIALLIAILMPALRRAMESAKRVQCMSNMRTLTQATILYANDWKDVMPFNNWGSNDTTGSIGWLYNGNASMGASANLYQNFKPTYVTTGSLYKYIRNPKTYRCPAHEEIQFPGTTMEMTSYTMNGAVNGFGALPAANSKQAAYKRAAFQRKSKEAVVFWETNEYRDQFGWNDGSNYPNAVSNVGNGEPVTTRHAGNGRSANAGMARPVGGSVFACFDGSAQFVDFTVFDQWAKSAGPSPMWCNPGTNNGH